MTFTPMNTEVPRTASESAHRVDKVVGIEPERVEDVHQDAVQAPAAEDDRDPGPAAGSLEVSWRASVWRWPRLIPMALIRGYQVVISPLFGPSCRYYPCCSSYALTALSRHGLLRGSWLTLWRVLRCNPWSKGGVDHVPDRGHRHHRPFSEPMADAGSELAPAPTDHEESAIHD